MNYKPLHCEKEKQPKEYLNEYKMSDLRDILIKERIRQGLTQKQLSAKCGLCNTHISAYEIGVREPSIKTFIKAANALDLNVKIIVERKNK